MPKRSQPAAASAIPAWFMTYSDVITLMMTFFILLLTFATNEPEKFERMKVAVFGGGGGSGVAGENPKAIDHDSMVLRYRPKTARQTTRGSETPPMFEDPPTESVSQGLQSLDELTDLAQAERCSISLRKDLLLEGNAVSPHGQQILRMIGHQLRRFNGQARLVATSPEDAAALIPVCLAVAAETQTLPANFSVGMQVPRTAEDRQRITIIVTRDLR